jgi:hypothetical protein
VTNINTDELLNLQNVLRETDEVIKLTAVTLAERAPIHTLISPDFTDRTNAT